MKIEKFQLITIIILFAMFALILTVIAFFYAPIGQDAGYYIAIARKISDGSLIYRDINTSYTPLGIALLSIPYCFFNTPSYEWFYGVYYLFVLGSTFILYKIIALHSKDNWLRLLGTLVGLVLMLFMGGIYVNLEPFSVFFVLLATFLVEKKKGTKLDALLAGVAVALSFFCKQYGGLIALPLFYYLVVIKKQSKTLLLVILGGLLTFAGYFIFFMLHGMDIFDVLLTLIGKYNFVESFVKVTGHHYSFLALGVTLFKLYTHTYIVFIVIGLWMLFRRKFWLRENSMYIIAGIIFHIPLIFAYNWHYFQYISPWLVLITVIWCEQNRQFFKNKKWRFFVLFFIMIVLSVKLTIYYYQYMFGNTRQKQLQIAEQINQIMPVGSIAITTDAWMLFPCKIESPSPDDVGYGFITSASADFLDSILQQGNWFIVSGKLSDSLKNILNNYIYKGNVSKYEIYYKK